MDDVTVEAERRLTQRIEQLVGGRVVSMSRQVRWRPSWFVDVDVGGRLVKVYVRGDRGSDVVPFPELKREADILSVLGQNGIPAPQVYGMCDDPVAIVMESCAGTRDVSEAASDAQRTSVARQYIEALAAMHQLPLEPFAAIGLSVPQGAEQIALAGLEAYLPLYQRHKAKPEPLVEFAMKWLRANVPRHRTQPCFTAFDAGQFLFSEGKITTLYDFEFAMIGDPMVDIATMAMRHSHEPMGEEIDALCAYYGELTGSPVDQGVVRYHHAVFATVACMQFIGTIANPKPGDPHDIYLEWVLALRRSLVNALAASIDVALVPPPPLQTVGDASGKLYFMLDDMNRRIVPADEMAGATQKSAARLVEYAERVSLYGPQLEVLALSDAEALLGKCGSFAEMEARLEDLVQEAGPAQDRELLQFFARQVERQVMAYGDTAIGQSAAHIRLESIG
jgi:aminoglycoside phosphotransferase (APT) family kinase protein